MIGPFSRKLNEFDVFVRDKRAVDILQKVVSHGQSSFEELVSGDTPFGLPTNFTDYERDAVPDATQLLVYANVGTKRVRGALTREAISKTHSSLTLGSCFFLLQDLAANENEVGWIWFWGHQ